MFPNPFEYHRATSVSDALALLQQYGDEAKIIAGGHSLLPTMKLRLASPGHLVDISGIAGLSGVRIDGDTLVIGAMTTHREISENALIRQHAPLLAQIARTIGDRQVRNRGTIGGALAHADPAADYPAGIIAFDATISAIGPDGEYTIPASDFFVSIFTTALAPDDVLTEIRVPLMAAKTGTAYEKLPNPSSGYAMVGIAVSVTLDDSGAAADVRIGVTGVTDHAFRASDAETALTGTTLTPEAVTAATKNIAGDRDVLADIHASEAYRRRVADGLAARALLAAAQNAR